MNGAAVIEARDRHQEGIGKIQQQQRGFLASEKKWISLATGGRGVEYM